MNEKNIPYSVQVKDYHVDNDNEWFQKHPYHPTKRELRKHKKENKQTGNQIRRTKEKRELQEMQKAFFLLKLQNSTIEM